MARALKLSDVIAKTSLQKTAIYAKIASGEFPAPAKIGERRSAWLEDEVDAWIVARFSENRGTAEQPRGRDGVAIATKPRRKRRTKAEIEAAKAIPAMGGR